MNYVEIVKRQEELETEMRELQQARILSAQSHESFNASDSDESGLSVHLDINYDSDSKDVITVVKGDTEIAFSVEEFNFVNQFLGQYNDAIYSYMSTLYEAGKLDAETDEDATEDNTEEA